MSPSQPGPNIKKTNFQDLKSKMHFIKVKKKDNDEVNHIRIKSNIIYKNILGTYNRFKYVKI